MAFAQSIFLPNFPEAGHIIVAKVRINLFRLLSIFVCNEWAVCYIIKFRSLRLIRLICWTRCQHVRFGRSVILHTLLIQYFIVYKSRFVEWPINLMLATHMSSTISIRLKVLLVKFSRSLYICPEHEAIADEPIRGIYLLDPDAHPKCQ